MLSDSHLLAIWQMNYRMLLVYVCIETSMLIFRIFHFYNFPQLFRKLLSFFKAQIFSVLAKHSFSHNFIHMILSFSHIFLQNFQSSFVGFISFYSKVILLTFFIDFMLIRIN